MGADGGVGGGDVVGVRVEGEGLLVEVDGAEELGVAGRDEVEDAGETGADLVVGLGGWRGLEFVSKGFEGLAFGGAAAVVVDDGVAQDTIEPGDDRLFQAGYGVALQGAHVGGLEDVFGEGGAGNATAHEAEELAAVVEERVEGGFGHGCVGDLRPPWLVSCA